MLEQERVTGWADMPPNHINKWTPHSLALALDQAGFTIEKSMREPLSWKTFMGAIYSRILTDAMQPQSIGAQIYRINKRSLRVALLSLLVLPALLKLLPHWQYFGRRGSFVVRARVRRA
jgi:hypothetical protein